MFLRFDSDEQRRSYGGSAFIELQYCTQPNGADRRKIFDIARLPYWAADGLYVHINDAERFALYYRELLGEAEYPNGQSGLYDESGVNRFPPERLSNIMSRLSDARPPEYDILLSWLDGARKHNGFYILGL